MKKLLLTSLSALLCFSLTAQQSTRSKNTQKRKSESALQQKVKTKVPALLQLTGGINSLASYIAGTTMNLNFILTLSNTDFEYGDSLSITFPAGITPLSSPTDPLGPDDGQAGSDGPEVLNGVSGQTISWGNNDNSYGGIVPGNPYPFVVNVSIAPGTSGIQLANFHVSGDLFGGNPGDLNGTITLIDVAPVFTGCLPTNIYGPSAWQEPTSIGTAYSGYVCNGHDSLQTRSGWNFYDGDGYFVSLIAGGQYRITLDSCTSPIAITVSDSNGVAGTIISNVFVNAACPNQLTFTAPYTGKYYINTSLNGICGTSGTVPIASGGVKLLNSANCPALPVSPLNDTICGAITMALDSTYFGDNTGASLTDPRDADVIATGFGCSAPSNTLWYSYTALVTDTFFINVNSPTTGGLDAWVGLFEAASCNSAFVSGECLIGPIPGTSYTDTVLLTAGITYFIMIDGYAGAVGTYDIILTRSNGVTPVFTGCLPSNTYSVSAWQEPTAIGLIYTGYVCDGHDSLQTRAGWNFYDGDGYDVKLVAGGQYRISLDSCTAPVAITVSDSNGVAGAIINGAYITAACPNQFVFTAPYTGRYYINSSLNAICGNSGIQPIASGAIKLLNSATCPALPVSPVNDTICGAITMTLDSTYFGDNTGASSTDPRDADVIAAGFGCSAPSNTLWYSYTALVTDTFYINVNSPATGGLDAWVGLFEAATCNSAFTSGACLIGPIPGSNYEDTVLLTAGTTYFIMIDGYAGAVGTYDITLSQSNGTTPLFNGCLPTNTYAASAWQEPTALGVVYNGYVCNGHDSLQTRAGWNFYDGDGYDVKLVAGGQYRFSIDSCAAPIALTLSDSNGVAGTIIPGAFIGPACPNSLTFTAPYTGKYYLNASLNGICGNSGTLPIASASVKLLNSVICPTAPTAPINDTICGAIAMTLGVSYNGNTTTASASDPRDNDAVAAGFACSIPNNTLWYSYTAAASDTFFINVNSPTIGGLDVWVGFFEASNCSSAFLSGACLLGPVPGSDYIDTVVLVAGSTYYIMLDGYNNATGAFSINITQNSSSPTYPVNDTLCGAIALNLGVTVSGNNTSANLIDPNDANAISAGFTCDVPSNTLWYTYTPAVSDTFYITTFSNNSNGVSVVLGIFEASSCSSALSNGQCLVAATPGGGNHVDSVILSSGITYYFMLDGVSGSTGTFDLTLTRSTTGVGMNTISDANQISVYPNPTNALLNIKTQAISTDIVIYNALGEKVFEQIKLNKGLHSIQFGDLAKGIYTLKATANNKVERIILSIID
jgi:hypothetical protein